MNSNIQLQEFGHIAVRSWNHRAFKVIVVKLTAKVVIVGEKGCWGLLINAEMTLNY